MLRFFGDSITAGYGATQPERTWPRVFASRQAGPFQNLAVSGAMAFDMAPPIYATTIEPGDVSLYMIGTNDERIYGTSAAGLSSFRRAVMAEYAWLGLTEKITGKSAGVTYAGDWTDTYVYGIGRRSQKKDSKASFTLSGPVIYVSLIQQSGVTGSCDILVDGVLKATHETMALVPNTVNGLFYGPSCVRIGDLTDEPHTVEIVQTSPDGSLVYFDWAGVPAAEARVGAISLIRKTPSAHVAYGGSEWNVLQYREAQRQIVQQMVGDGFDIGFHDVYPAINPTSDLMDGVHPNDSGHSLLADAVRAGHP